MEIITTTAALRQWRRSMEGKSVGFVPTMGALHKGHLSLVERCGKENDIVAVSIFVNPTQFNDTRDLEHYPRCVDADLTLLSATKCSMVFVPSVEEIYPHPDTRIFDFGGLDAVMEGRHRSGHFNGVAQVVSILLGMVLPQRAYFGEKDYQQLVIVRRLVKDLGLPVQIAACPIVREHDGLAMSSRNALLTREQRIAAPLITRTLFDAVDSACSYSVAQLCERVAAAINSNSLMQLDYFEIVNAHTLQSVVSWQEPCLKRACIAVRMGNLRLIDNALIG
jgi:pantoate--beta-alanine ligase